MKLDPPRPKNKETERALFENLRNFLYEKQKVGNFSLNSERNKPKIVKIKKLVRNTKRGKTGGTQSPNFHIKKNV